MLPPTERVIRLLQNPPDELDTSAGYLDLLAPSTEPPPSLAQTVMQSTFLPHIYEKVWRPIGFNLAKGWPIGPDTATEHALARDWLGLAQPDDTVKPSVNVLDVACGPGNVTRALAAGVADTSLVIGLDASETMLTRAAADTPATAPVGYVRGNAVDLPFRDATFDAVCCFGALYLFDDPWTALDGMTRVLKPAGHLIILTSRRPLTLPTGIARAVVRRTTGITVFGDQEITSALADRGFTHIKHRRYPLMQLVAAQR